MKSHTSDCLDSLRCAYKLQVCISMSVRHLYRRRTGRREAVAVACWFAAGSGAAAVAAAAAAAAAGLVATGSAAGSAEAGCAPHTSRQAGQEWQASGLAPCRCRRWHCQPAPLPSPPSPPPRCLPAGERKTDAAVAPPHKLPLRLHWPCRPPASACALLAGGGHACAACVAARGATGAGCGCAARTARAACTAADGGQGGGQAVAKKAAGSANGSPNTPCQVLDEQQQLCAVRAQGLQPHRAPGVSSARGTAPAARVGARPQGA